MLTVPDNTIKLVISPSILSKAVAPASIYTSSLGILTISDPIKVITGGVTSITFPNIPELVPSGHPILGRAHAVPELTPIALTVIVVG